MSAAAIMTERNRANAQHSTGPASDAGKATASQNARKHGLTGQLRLESKAESDRYHARCAEYTTQYAVSQPEAVHLVRQLVTAEFRLHQIWAVRNNVIAMLQENYIDEIDDSLTDPEDIRNRLAALVFVRDPQNGNVLQRLHRYEQAAHRTWYRTLDELRRLRDEQARDRRTQAEVQAILNELKSSKTKVQNEPRRHEPIDLSNLPWFPKEPQIDLNFRDMVRKPAVAATANKPALPK